MVQVRSNCLVFYQQPVMTWRSSKGAAGAMQTGGAGAAGTYSGQVTEGAVKRIRKAVDILLQISPNTRIYNPVTSTIHDFRLNFITLTISDARPVNAKEGYQKLLGPWLQAMRRRAGLRDYVWKAELQARGQLHYHVTSNTFIDLTTIRQTWNQLQRKAGTSREFAKKYHHWNPNSIDVHAVHKINDIGAYLSKYLEKGVSKSSQSATLNGKVWDCSTKCKGKRFSAMASNEILDNCIREEANGNAQIIHLDKCTIVKTTNPVKLLSQSVANDYLNWL